MIHEKGGPVFILVNVADDIMHVRLDEIAKCIYNLNITDCLPVKTMVGLLYSFKGNYIVCSEKLVHRYIASAVKSHH